MVRRCSCKAYAAVHLQESQLFWLLRKVRIIVLTLRLCVRPYMAGAGSPLEASAILQKLLARAGSTMCS